MVTTQRLDNIHLNEAMLLQWAKDYPRQRLWVLTNYENYYPDVLRSIVVRADTEIKARKLAAENCGDEGTLYWLEDAPCIQLFEDGPTEVIVKGYRN